MMTCFLSLNICITFVLKMHSLEVFESYRDVNKIISCFNNPTYALHKYPGISAYMKFSQFST